MFLVSHMLGKDHTHHVFEGSLFYLYLICFQLVLTFPAIAVSVCVSFYLITRGELKQEADTNFHSFQVNVSISIGWHTFLFKPGALHSATPSSAPHCVHLGSPPDGRLLPSYRLREKQVSMMTSTCKLRFLLDKGNRK